MWFKMIFLTLALLGGGFLQAREYPVLEMKVERVSGAYIDRWEIDKFLGGLEKVLAHHRDIRLAYRAPYLLRVSIFGYSKNFTKYKEKFLGLKQYWFKQDV